MKNTSSLHTRDIDHMVTATLGNDMSRFYDAAPLQDMSGLRTGEIYALANDANFDAALLRQPLSEFATGVPGNADLQRLLNSICPTVRTARRFSYQVHNEKGGFIDRTTSDQDKRALGGEFATVRTVGSEANGRTYSKGLMQVLDEDEGGDDPAVQQQVAGELLGELLLAEFIRALTIIDGASNNTAKTWSSGTSVTPDKDAMAAIKDSGDKRGIDPNVLLYGNGAWQERFGACQRNANPGVSAASLLTPQALASLLQVDAVEIAKVRKQNTSSAKTAAIGAVVYAYYASRTPSRRDPSNVKRFVSQDVQTYVITELKRTKIVVCHHSDIVATNSVGVEKLTIS